MNNNIKTAIKVICAIIALAAILFFGYQYYNTAKELEDTKNVVASAQIKIEEMQNEIDTNIDLLESTENQLTDVKNDLLSETEKSTSLNEQLDIISNELSTANLVIEALKDEKFITMPSRSSLYDITYTNCRACGFEPRVQFICDDPYFVRKYISENMGIALSPAVSWSERFRANTVIVPIDNPPIHTTTYLLWDENKYMSPAVRKFMQFVIEQAKSLEGNLLNQSVNG